MSRDRRQLCRGIGHHPGHRLRRPPRLAQGKPDQRSAACTRFTADSAVRPSCAPEALASTPGAPAGQAPHLLGCDVGTGHLDVPIQHLWGSGVPSVSSDRLAGSRAGRRRWSSSLALRSPQSVETISGSIMNAQADQRSAACTRCMKDSAIRPSRSRSANKWGDPRGVAVGRTSRPEALIVSRAGPAPPGSTRRAPRHLLRVPSRAVRGS